MVFTVLCGVWSTSYRVCTVLRSTGLSWCFRYIGRIDRSIRTHHQVTKWTDRSQASTFATIPYFEHFQCGLQSVYPIDSVSFSVCTTEYGYGLKMDYAVHLIHHGAPWTIMLFWKISIEWYSGVVGNNLLIIHPSFIKDIPKIL